MCEIVANLYYAKTGKKLHACIKKITNVSQSRQHTNNLAYKNFLIHNNQVFGKKNRVLWRQEYFVAGDLKLNS